MPPKMPDSDTSRAPSMEPNKRFPEELRIVAKWGNNRATSILIPRGEYFGEGAFGAPLNGERLMHKIDILRKAGPAK